MNSLLNLMRQGARPVSRPGHRPAEGARLTADQKKMAAEIASRFDPATDSPTQRKEMRAAFHKAKIGPGHDLKNVLEQSGFKVGPPPEEKQKAAQDGQPKHRGRQLGPPPGLPDFAQAFIEKKKAGKASKADADALRDQLRTMDSPPKGVFVNLVA